MKFTYTSGADSKGAYCQQVRPSAVQPSLSLVYAAIGGTFIVLLGTVVLALLPMV